MITIGSCVKDTRTYEKGIGILKVRLKISLIKKNTHARVLPTLLHQIPLMKGGNTMGIIKVHADNLDGLKEGVLISKTEKSTLFIKEELVFIVANKCFVPLQASESEDTSKLEGELGAKAVSSNIIGFTGNISAITIHLVELFKRADHLRAASVNSPERDGENFNPRMKGINETAGLKLSVGSYEPIEGTFMLPQRERIAGLYASIGA